MIWARDPRSTFGQSIFESRDPHGTTGETNDAFHEMHNYRLLLISAASAPNRLERRRLF
jgi:hypothetical protein